MTAPPLPTNFAGEVRRQATIRLSWTDSTNPDNDVSHYLIEHEQNDGQNDFVALNGVGTVTQGVQVYEHKNADYRRRNRYRLRVVDDSGNNAVTSAIEVPALTRVTKVLVAGAVTVVLDNY